MGAELFLLFGNVRSQILLGVKRRLFTYAREEIGKPTDDDAMQSRPDAEAKYNSLCIDAGRNSYLAVLSVLTVTLYLVSMLLNVSREPVFGSASLPTSVASASAGMVVFLGSQWMFFKYVVLPYYSDLYDKITGEDNPRFEKDPWNVTLTLLSPTLASVCTLLIVGALFYRSIDWATVGMAGALSVLSLATELVTWFMMKGFAVPVQKIVSAVTDTVTAIGWTNTSNSGDVALDALAKVLFPNGDPAESNLIGHVYRDNFDRKILKIGDGGTIGAARGGSDKTAIVFFACSLCLMISPFVALAFKATLVDAAVISCQMALIVVVYYMYTYTSGKTTTMQRLNDATSLSAENIYSISPKMGQKDFSSRMSFAARPDAKN